MTDRAPRTSLFRQVLRDPIHWLAFGLGTGLAPFAPGTFGSLFGVGIHLLLPPLSAPVQAGSLAAAFAAGCVICGISARRLGVHDHGGIVLDEIVAMLMVLAVTPEGPLWTALAFLAFRFMDIVKPWPIREADHSLPGGLGIMLDDVLAAVYAALVVRGVALLPL
jgi:phosphatidylglycerophosphatase A